VTTTEQLNRLSERLSGEFNAATHAALEDLGIEAMDVSIDMKIRLYPSDQRVYLVIAEPDAL